MSIYSTVSKRDGVRRWYVRYRTPSGGRRRELAGTRKREAEELLKQRLGEVAGGTWTDPKAPPPDPGMTFAQLGRLFLEEHTGRRRSNHYPVNVRQLVEAFGTVPVAEISRQAIDRYRLRIETEPRGYVGEGEQRRPLPPLSATTVLKRLRVLHRVLRFAVQRELLPYNPAAEIDKPAPVRHPTRYLTREEYDRLEAAAPTWLRPILRFAVCTGLRLKEVTSLTWGDVDLAAGVVLVPMDTKTGTRSVRLPTAARDVLKGVPRRIRSAHVFRDDAGQPITSSKARDRVSQRTRTAAKAAELTLPRAFHALRHTAASWMIQAGVPIYEVQRTLGHSSTALTERYAHLAPDYGEKGAAAIDHVFGGGPISAQAQAADGTGGA